MRGIQTFALATGTACTAVAMSFASALPASGSELPLRPLGQVLGNCGELDSVVAFSASNAWGVGGNACVSPTAVIEHWDGRQGTRVSVPQLYNGYEEYGSVAATGPSNIWAVGGDSSDGGSVGLIAHYNGTKWKLVPGPTGKFVESYLWDIRIATNGDLWTSGEVGNHAALMRVHNGRNTVIKIPSAGAVLRGLYLASSTDIWAGGGGYLVHGDGKHWQVLLAPGGVDIYRIAGSSASNIWAIAPGSLLHYDGHQWITAANSGTTGPYLEGLSVRGTDMWLSGTRSSGSTVIPYASHWNGKVQTNITVQLPPSSTQADLRGITATAHGLFAVGQVWSNTSLGGTQMWSTTG